MFITKLIAGMKFQKLGGSYHLYVDSADDLRLITNLDEPFWMATSAAVNSFVGDPRLYSFLDRDKNKRIRCLEIKEAIRWLFSVLKDVSHLGTPHDILHLDCLDTGNEAGRKIMLAAERILSNLQSPRRDIIELEQVRDRTRIVAAASTNGDGIIPPCATDESPVQAFIQDIISLYVGAVDAGGNQGLTEKNLDQFFDEATSFMNWFNLAHTQSGEEIPFYFPWADNTEKVKQMVGEMAEKIDKYFLLCQSTNYFRSLEEMIKEAAPSPLPFVQDMVQLDQVLPNLPLSVPSPDHILFFDNNINPYYRTRIEELRTVVFEPLFGAVLDGLKLEQWIQVKLLIDPYIKWLELKPSSTVESLGPDKIRQYLQNDYIRKVRNLIEQDNEIGKELAASEEVERLILYQRWLPRVVNNFVSFPELYDPARRALFEWGKLVLDGRTFRLCLPVHSRSTHQQIARYSGMYLLYIKLSQKAEGPFQEIVVAVTSGSAGRICAGKKGIFYSHDNHEYDAEVIEIIKNPISLVEAFFHPFRRLGEIMEIQIEKIIGRGEKELETALEKRTSLISQSIERIETQPDMTDQINREKLVGVATSPATAGSEKNFIRDLIVGISLSVAAIGSSFAFITKIFSEVKFSHILATLLACIILILGPITLLTLIKLHRRDIGMLLEASGWAINGRMRLTRSLARVLTFDPPSKRRRKKKKEEERRKNRDSRT